MNEADDSNLSVETDSEPSDGKWNTLGALKLPLAIQAIAWSTGAAVLTWLSTCLGQSYLSGRYAALGLDGLSIPSINQGYVTIGIGIFLQTLIFAVVGLLMIRLCYIALRWGARIINRRFGWGVPAWIVKRLWLLTLLIIFADAGFFFHGMLELQKQGSGMILKGTSEVGSIWTQIVFDSGRETAGGLEFAYGAGLGAFVGLTWWLIMTKLKNPWGRIALSLYALGGTFSFLFGYAYLLGMADTVHDFPVAAFSGMSEGDHGYVPFLLGQDDKAFAFLVLKLDGNSQVETKYILYAPRTEIKWITIIRYMPLYNAADLNDLRRLAQQAKDNAK